MRFRWVSVCVRIEPTMIRFLLAAGTSHWQRHRWRQGGAAKVQMTQIIPV